MSWSGQMKCVVVNGTGGPITRVIVSHKIEEVGGQTDLRTPTLDTDGTFEGTINVGSGGSDLWMVHLVSGNFALSHGRKKCDIEESDYQSGAPVRIVLRGADDGFDISLPVTSSCIGNAYTQVMPLN